MIKRGMSKVALVAGLLSFVPVGVWASEDGGPGGGRKGPPPEAITACKGKQAGDSVEFTGRRGETVEATCKEIDGQLAAVPNKAPNGDGRR